MSPLQLALNVDDLEESVAFYSKLFGTEPHKTKPGYANFAVAEPPLKLVLIENHPGEGGSVNHLGVEVTDTDRVDAEQTRLAAEGLASIEERGTTCCYAKQDKFWGRGRSERRALGDLHRVGGQRVVRRRRHLCGCVLRPGRGGGGRSDPDRLRVLLSPAQG